jgi:hypothetical protein
VITFVVIGGVGAAAVGAAFLFYVMKRKKAMASMAT